MSTPSAVRLQLRRPIDWVLRHRIISLGLLSLAMGVMAAWGVKSQVQDFLAAERERLRPQVKTVEIVVAKRNLKAGDAVSADTMALRQVPEAYAASQAVREESFKGYQGLRLTQALQAGEALLPVMVAGAEVASFSARIKPGIRAMTLQVDEVNSVSGMLQPGDRIDLLMSARLPAASSAPAPGAPAMPADRTVALMQDLLILATGRSVRPGGSEETPSRGFNAITVEVSPEQAQRLVVAQRAGKLTALLRNPGDRRESSSRALDVHELLGVPRDLPRAPAAAIVASTPEGTEIIVGGRGLLAGGAHAAAAGTPGAPGSPVTPAASVVPSSPGRPLSPSSSDPR